MGQGIMDCWIKSITAALLGSTGLYSPTFFTYAKYSQSLVYFVAGAHKAARPLLPLRGHRRLGRWRVALLLATAPMKCTRALVPAVVATASSEAARDPNFHN